MGARDSSAPPDKAAVRRAMREMRRAQPAARKAEADAAICARLAGRGGLPAGCRTVAVYLALPDEIDLSPLIADLLSRGALLAAPRWDGRCYRLARLSGLDAVSLRRGPMGVMEPAAADEVPPGRVDAWIVPGLAFARDGRRLGYGGGWYDRMLAGARPGSAVIGVAYPFQVVDDLPVGPHDIPMTAVVSPA